MGLSPCDLVVVDFFEKRNGHLIILSQDWSVHRTLRATITRGLAVRRGSILHSSATEQATREISSRYSDSASIVVLAERILRGRPRFEYLGEVKKSFPAVKLIVLTAETYREILVYLHELGADNIVTKPASMDCLIRKMAGTITPMGRVNQLMHVGRKSLEGADPVLALRVAETVLAEHPDNASALLLKGDALLAMGDRPRAEACYRVSWKKCKDFIDPIKRLADLYKRDNQDKYLACLKKMDRISPLNKERKVEIGGLCAGNGQLRLAERYFESAMQCAEAETKGVVRSYSMRIAKKAEKHAPGISEKYLIRRIRANRVRATAEDMEAYNRLGIVLRKQGKWREAVDNYKKAISLAPGDENLHYNLGMAYLMGDKPAQARTCLEKALSLNPRFHLFSDTVCFHYAYVYHQLGLSSQARTYLQGVLSLRPGHQRALALLKRLGSPQLRKTPGPLH